MEQENKGWVCPKCQAILSPVQTYCPFCTKPVKEQSQTEERKILLESK
jgi:predicted amidophosphoribosyltransferase